MLIKFNLVDNLMSGIDVDQQKKTKITKEHLSNHLPLFSNILCEFCWDNQSNIVILCIILFLSVSFCTFIYLGWERDKIAISFNCFWFMSNASHFKPHWSCIKITAYLFAWLKAIFYPTESDCDTAKPLWDQSL